MQLHPLTIIDDNFYIFSIHLLTFSLSSFSSRSLSAFSIFCSNSSMLGNFESSCRRFSYLLLSFSSRMTFFVFFLSLKYNIEVVVSLFKIPYSLINEYYNKFPFSLWKWHCSCFLKKMRSLGFLWFSLKWYHRFAISISISAYRQWDEISELSFRLKCFTLNN